MSIMPCIRSSAAQLASATVGILLMFSTGSLAQTTALAASPVQALDLECNGTRILDPFKGKMTGPALPPEVLASAIANKDSILKSGLPCQENVGTGAQGDPAGIEASGLENLQRGFDFYSWRTFIALNSPDDGTPIEKAQADTPTKWEHMNNFKQLLDVMLPADQQPPIWPTDTNGMKAERARLMPEACRELLKERPDLKEDEPNRMIVKMIEESFNEPFKTGPLIDQQGHYAIFDILMNRQMFQYITDNHLNTKAGQAANADLAVDFPPGQNAGAAFGSFMLKVSWKILTDDEKAAKTFHMRRALVLMPPGEKRPCLDRTLGLIGFHAVHKTVGRPQWIWTSFEHVKNVPDRTEVATNKLSGPYNFFSVKCKTDCPTENATPPFPWDPDPALELSFRKDDSFKSQIVRETPLTDAAKNMNEVFHSMLPANSVWQNYMLLSTQWPTAFLTHCTGLRSQNAGSPAPQTDFVKQPDMTCSPAPTYLANSTLETYSQAEKKPDSKPDSMADVRDAPAVPLATSSCIACHSNAAGFQRTASNREGGRPNLNQSDFTFMLEKAQ
ncbi:hypothetical protein CT676_27820 [Bradyrhizobium sp. MOS001]|uniref:hypothetical protein n=1 Tax=Bradyrhizobium sp. MOS001 TaxID=2133948 RepID=UPI001074D8B9|nr:hypothetical protein [Bradyrhizobium sp. MOS001]TFW57814.1 hypothetical protein CT676_27820 [Bradyrhizobium sp. MOS001]